MEISKTVILVHMLPAKADEEARALTGEFLPG